MLGCATMSVFSEVLQHASPGFALGEKLAALYPQLHMLETESGLFDVADFARNGHCTIERRDGMYHQYDSYWHDGHVHTTPSVTWLKVEWSATTFDVVQLEWPNVAHKTTRHYILAPERAQCEALL